MSPPAPHGEGFCVIEVALLMRNYLACENPNNSRGLLLWNSIFDELRNKPVQPPSG